MISLKPSCFLLTETIDTFALQFLPILWTALLCQNNITATNSKDLQKVSEGNPMLAASLIINIEDNLNAESHIDNASSPGEAHASDWVLVGVLGFIFLWLYC